MRFADDNCCPAQAAGVGSSQPQPTVRSVVLQLVRPTLAISCEGRDLRWPLSMTSVRRDDEPISILPLASKPPLVSFIALLGGSPIYCGSSSAKSSQVPPSSVNAARQSACRRVVRRWLLIV